MKLGVFVAIAAAALAACGGGGGSSGGGGPVPQPSPTHSGGGVGQYSVHLMWTGGDALHSTQSKGGPVRTHVFDVRRTLTSGVTEPAVILPVNVPQNSYFQMDGPSEGDATLVVSPAPSVEPSAAFVASGAPVSTTPVPYPSGQPTGAPRAAVIASPTDLTPGSGTLAVNVGSPVNQNIQAPIYVVGRAHIACSSTPLLTQDGRSIMQSDQVGGIAFVGGQANAVSTTGAADFYIDGASCTAVGFVNPNDPNPTFYAPYGAVLLSSTQTPYAQIAPPMWANTFTSITSATLQQEATDPYTPLDELLIQTASGSVVKIAMNAVGGSPVSEMDFSFEQDGFAQDGF